MWTIDSLEQLEALAEQRRSQIRNRPDTVTVSGRAYYVSNDGDDAADGSLAHPWRTLAQVSQAALLPGDGVFFRRGDLFRGCVLAKAGVTYAAYGSGEKPRFYSGDFPLSVPDLWELYDAPTHIWRLKQPFPDCGTLVFNGGQAHCRKLIPSYIGGRFVCRDDESRLFDPRLEMTQDLDLVCLYDAKLTTTPSKGQDFPIPQMDSESPGTLLLRCDRGNPGSCFASIEALARRHMFQLDNCADVTLDNLCIQYVGQHAICAGGDCVRNLRVSGCEIGWVGGCIQHYLGTDPNYPQGGRGTVTRYGNAIEIYGGCDGYWASDCYIYQVYDAGITHQITTNGRNYQLNDIHYRNNLIEYCVYSIEYFLEKTDGDTQSSINGCEITGNILRLSGYGWGQQRHNTDTPAHIKGWSYENTATDFTVSGNIFDRAAYRMLHLVARDEASLPTLADNLYLQHQGLSLGQYGANRIAEPSILPFTPENVHGVFRDRDARVLTLPPQP